MTAPISGTEGDAALPLQVAVVSDYICPWCYLATARVDRMVREFAVAVEWIPFELHPQTPAAGVPRAQAPSFLSPAMERHLAALAAEAGLPLVPNPVLANGHNALAAAEWAREQGPAPFAAAHRALFHAYFAEARNISTIDQVEAVLAGAGLDGAALRHALQRNRYRVRVDELTALARRNGISSTPTFVLADRFTLSGVQDWSLFESALTRLQVPRRERPAPEAL